MEKNKITILLPLIIVLALIILFTIFKLNPSKHAYIKKQDNEKRLNAEKILPETKSVKRDTTILPGKTTVNSTALTKKNITIKHKKNFHSEVPGNLVDSLLNCSPEPVVVQQPVNNDLMKSKVLCGQDKNKFILKRIEPGTTCKDNFPEKTSLTFFARQPIKPVINVLTIASNDILALITSPLNWDSTDFFIYPSLALTTYLFMIEDQPIHNWISHYGTAKEIPIMKFGTIYGQAITTQLSALSVFTFGIIFNNKEAEQIGLEIFESYFIANNITSVLKRIFGRDRPYENNGPYHFDPFPSRANPINSFPSGHSTLAFSMSSVLAAHTNNLWLKALIFSPAVITAVSRVYHNVHWFSDVFMGSAIGYLVGNYLVDRHNGKRTDHIHIGFDNYGRFSLQFNF